MCIKLHFRYKTSDISETKQSKAKVTTYSVCRNLCTAYWLVRNLVTECELWPNIPGATFPQRISRTLLVEARQNLAALGGWSKKTYSPNFVNFDPGVSWYHAATCISPSLIHLWFFENFPMFVHSYFVTLTFNLLTLDSGHIWRATLIWSTPPPCFNILRLFVLELWVTTSKIAQHWILTIRL